MSDYTHEHSTPTSDQPPEKGLLLFIKTKLENSVHPHDIKQMLLRAGFANHHIEHAFKHVRKTFDDTHQDVAAINNFLPPLFKHKNDHATHADATDHMAGMTAQSSINTSEHPHGTIQHKGLFAGRLRRKDFVMGFLFFFGIGYITIAFSAILLSQMAPGVWQYMLDTIADDSNNFLLMIVPVVLAPITIISLSMIARRLHNLGLPGGLSFLFLMWFVPAFSQVSEFGFAAFELALFILFIVLVVVKGSPEPNKYGPWPESRGSFFRRILNI